MSITASVIPNNPLNISVDLGNEITSNVIGDLQLKSDVTIDSRKNRIVATTATIGDLAGLFEDLNTSLLNNEFSTFYSEYTYSNDYLNGIEIWESINKESLLFTKVYHYTNDDLSSVILTDVINNKTLTKTLTYDIEGNLESINRINK